MTKAVDFNASWRYCTECNVLYEACRLHEGRCIRCHDTGVLTVIEPLKDIWALPNVLASFAALMLIVFCFFCGYMAIPYEREITAQIAQMQVVK